MSMLNAFFDTLKAAAPGTITLPATEYVGALTFGATCTASITYESDGDITAAGNSVFPTDRGDWISPTSAAPSLYQIRATSASGTAIGTFGTWLNLTTSRTWTVTQTLPGIKSDDITIEIRFNGGPVIDSCVVTLYAEYS